MRDNGRDGAYGRRSAALAAAARSDALKQTARCALLANNAFALLAPAALDGSDSSSGCSLVIVAGRVPAHVHARIRAREKKPGSECALAGSLLSS